MDSVVVIAISIADAEEEFVLEQRPDLFVEISKTFRFTLAQNSP
jgi:hypothetical protein